MRLLACLLFSIPLTALSEGELQKEGAQLVDDRGEAYDEGEEAAVEHALSVAQIKDIHTLMDNNTDGKLHLDELQAFAKNIRLEIAKKTVITVMSEMDSDQDGHLSLEELTDDLEREIFDDAKQKSGSTGSDSTDAEEKKELDFKKFHLADWDGDKTLNDEEAIGFYFPETNATMLHLVAEHMLKTKDTDGDGKLTPEEFWHGQDVVGQDTAREDEEKEDFAKLDQDKDGHLNVEELMPWEAGHFHNDEALKTFMHSADNDHDGHISGEEMDKARGTMAGSDFQYHLMEWVEHHEL